MDKILIAQKLLAKSASNYGYDYGSEGGFLAFFFWFFFMLAFYVYGSLTLMIIAKKTNTAHTWMAWVPFLNLYLLCRAANKSLIWFVLLLLPFINIVATIILWAAIAERRKRPAWWGLLMILPIVSLVIRGVLAFGSVSQGESCAKCGSGVSGADKFCQSCGTKIAKKGNSCPKCQAKITVSDKFCPGCGSKL